MPHGNRLATQLPNETPQVHPVVVFQNRPWRSPFLLQMDPYGLKLFCWPVPLINSIDFLGVKQCSCLILSHVFHSNKSSLSTGMWLGHGPVWGFAEPWDSSTCVASISIFKIITLQNIGFRRLSVPSWHPVQKLAYHLKLCAHVWEGVAIFLKFAILQAYVLFAQGAVEKREYLYSSHSSTTSLEEGEWPGMVWKWFVAALMVYFWLMFIPMTTTSVVGFYNKL